MKYPHPTPIVATLAIAAIVLWMQPVRLAADDTVPNDALLEEKSSMVEQIIYSAHRKKLIEFSHNSPTLEQYLQNIQLYESGPFDGITLRLTPNVESGNVFMVDNWMSISAETRQAERDLVRQIRSRTSLSQHFLVLFGASQMDWFADEDWLLVKDHVQFAAQLAREGGFRGILWDPEPYSPGKNPWRYPEQEGREQLSYHQFYAKARERGTEFIETIQQEFPGAVILSLRELSDYQKGSPFSQSLLPIADVATAVSSLEGSWWGLHLPFTLGIVEAINDDMTFIDGNEEAYYYTSPLEYYRLRDVLYNNARRLMPPELFRKFESHYDIGHAIAPEYIAGNWAGLLTSFPVGLTEQSLMLTPEERAQWLEHSVYYSLSSSDEYAWMYSEKINWWTGENLPEGFVDAVASARQKVEALEPLGFEVEDMLETARAEAALKYAK
jgi:hypothetical protein